MNQWLTQQGQALGLVLSRFKKNSASTLLITLAIGVTLALPVVLYTALDNLNSLVNSVKKESTISVFLSKDHDEAMQQNIQQVLEKNTSIQHVELVPKDEALKQLAATNANEDIINSLEENPLPDAFFITPKSLDAVELDRLKYEIGQLPAVAHVLVDGAWIKRLNYLLALGKKIMLVLAALLGLVMFAVIGNTLRMQILTQRAEIELSQLIGATTSFIRRPFLYAGALYGLLGGLFSLGIASLVLWLFNTSIAPLAAEYHSDFALGLPSVSTSIATCLVAIIIGLISSFLAVSKSSSETIR